MHLVHLSPRAVRMGQREKGSKYSIHPIPPPPPFLHPAATIIHAQFKSDHTTSQTPSGLSHKQLGGPHDPSWGSLSSPCIFSLPLLWPDNLFLHERLEDQAVNADFEFPESSTVLKVAVK